MRALLIIPALNEAAAIADVIGAARGHFSGEVVVIDDGSEDATGALARAAGAIVIRHPCNLGIGAAVQTGFIYALTHGYEAVVRQDGDGQHDPAQIPRLLEHLRRDEADIVVGSRFLAREGYHSTLVRRLGIFILGVVSALVGARVTDPSNAAFMGVYNTVTLRGWNDELLDAIGASRKVLPEILDGNRIGGRITPAAASRFGLTQGTPMTVGLMDTSAAMLLAGARPGQLVNTSGSTDVLAACTARPQPHERLLTRPLGLPGIGLAASIAAAVNVVVLVAALRHREGRLRGRAVAGSFVRIALAAGVMGAFLAGVLRFVPEQRIAGWPGAGILAATILAATVVYAVDLRSQLLGADKLVEEALDPYLFVRGAYLERRAGRVEAVREGKDDEDAAHPE